MRQAFFRALAAPLALKTHFFLPCSLLHAAEPRRIAAGDSARLCLIPAPFTLPPFRALWHLCMPFLPT